MTEQHFALLRQVAKEAQATDQDIGLSANVVTALLDEIVELRKKASAWERRARELENICSDRL